MSWVHALAKGAVIGFAIAAPIGPIGVLCIRRTLQHGRISGLVTGLGASVADTLFAFVAAFGLTFVSDFLHAHLNSLRLLGGLFLLYLGLKTFFSEPANVPKQVSVTNYFSQFISTFILTITNPLTIFGFAALFAASGMRYTPGDLLMPAVLVTGVFMGSAFWWVAVSEGFTFYKKRITQTTLRWINKVAAVIITGFGVYVLLLL